MKVETRGPLVTSESLQAIELAAMDDFYRRFVVKVPQSPGTLKAEWIPDKEENVPSQNPVR